MRDQTTNPPSAAEARELFAWIPAAIDDLRPEVVAEIERRERARIERIVEDEVAFAGLELPGIARIRSAIRGGDHA